MQVGASFKGQGTIDYTNLFTCVWHSWLPEKVIIVRSLSKHKVLLLCMQIGTGEVDLTEALENGQHNLRVPLLTKVCS